MVKLVRLVKFPNFLAIGHMQSFFLIKTEIVVLLELTIQKQSKRIGLIKRLFLLAYSPHPLHFFLPV